MRILVPQPSHLKWEIVVNQDPFLTIARLQWGHGNVSGTSRK